MKPLVVVDASIAIGWMYDEGEDRNQLSASVYAAALRGLIKTSVPAIFQTEVAHQLLKKGRANRYGEAKIAEQAEWIMLAIHQQSHVRAYVAELVRFAVRHNVQGFDAHYLSLAISMGATLATSDRGLRAAAVRAGVPIWEFSDV